MLLTARDVVDTLDRQVCEFVWVFHVYSYECILVEWTTQIRGKMRINYWWMKNEQAIMLVRKMVNHLCVQHENFENRAPKNSENESWIGFHVHVYWTISKLVMLIAIGFTLRLHICIVMLRADVALLWATMLYFVCNLT